MDMQTAAALNLPPMMRFAITLFLLLIIPSLTQRLRIPSCVGFIAAGVLIGPHVLGVVPQHAAVANFFAELGKLLLMFFVGLEIDLRQFSASWTRSLLFGLLTFALPMVAGTVIGTAFGYNPIAAVLIGSLIASHTLIAYPIVEASHQATRPSVTITVGATILTDMLSLLVLTMCVTTFKSGFDTFGLIIQLGELVVFVVVIVVGLGSVGKWLFDRFGRTDDACFALLLVIVSIAATLAEVIQLEGILGAFLAGLAVNAAVRSSPAKDKLEFLGNVLFIPAFFIVTGFLIDLRMFLSTLVSNTPMVLAIVLGLVVTKWLAAEIVGRIWRFGSGDRGLMASLTLPQVAATLAAALVGFQTVNAAGVQLIDQAMLNTILVLVVVTSLLGPIMTQRFLHQFPTSGVRPGHGGAVPQAVDVPGDPALTPVEPARQSPA
jgi:Kef-type K+ transport system membrane component KefB